MSQLSSYQLLLSPAQTRRHPPGPSYCKFLNCRKDNFMRKFNGISFLEFIRHLFVQIANSHCRWHSSFRLYDLGLHKFEIRWIFISGRLQKYSKYYLPYEISNIYWIKYRDYFPKCLFYEISYSWTLFMLSGSYSFHFFLTVLVPFSNPAGAFFVLFLIGLFLDFLAKHLGQREGGTLWCVWKGLVGFWQKIIWQLQARCNPRLANRRWTRSRPPSNPRKVHLWVVFFWKFSRGPMEKLSEMLALNTSSGDIRTEAFIVHYYFWYNCRFSGMFHAGNW